MAISSWNLASVYRHPIPTSIPAKIFVSLTKNIWTGVCNIFAYQDSEGWKHRGLSRRWPCWRPPHSGWALAPCPPDADTGCLNNIWHSSTISPGRCRGTCPRPARRCRRLCRRARRGGCRAPGRGSRCRQTGSCTSSPAVHRSISDNLPLGPLIRASNEISRKSHNH